jgi:hypothetical protein
VVGCSSGQFWNYREWFSNWLAVKSWAWILNNANSEAFFYKLANFRIAPITRAAGVVIMNNQPV